MQDGKSLLRQSVEIWKEFAKQKFRTCHAAPKQEADNITKVDCLRFQLTFLKLSHVSRIGPPVHVPTEKCARSDGWVVVCR
jgi:hypothetical protein